MKTINDFELRLSDMIKRGVFKVRAFKCNYKNSVYNNHIYIEWIDMPECDFLMDILRMPLIKCGNILRTDFTIEWVNNKPFALGDDING